MATPSPADPRIPALESIRRRLAVASIRMTTAAESGHPSTCLSCSHLVAALYFGGFLRYDPAEPTAPDRDRFVLSKGHAAPILYAALAEAGVLPWDELMSLRVIGSRLEGHPNMRRVPLVEASTGSLGQGLSIGIGMALAGRLAGSDRRTWVLLGDGELDEGQVWEAAMAAAKFGLERLVAIVDRNGYQQMGDADRVMPTAPLAAKWAAFGWRPLEIDGHDWPAVLGALEAATVTDGRPTVVIAATQKGHGVRQILDDPGNKFHGVPLKPADAERAIAEIMDAPLPEGARRPSATNGEA